ncbi:hypothetical protein LEMLEM_LOCUS24666, partial [Lemmus lemmus]
RYFKTKLDIERPGSVFSANCEAVSPNIKIEYPDQLHRESRLVKASESDCCLSPSLPLSSSGSLSFH